MSAILRRRLEAIQATLAADWRTAEIDRKPAHLLTDAECVQAVYDLCHAHPPGYAGRPLSPAEESEVLRLRAFIRHSTRRI